MMWIAGIAPDTEWADYPVPGPYATREEAGECGVARCPEYRVSELLRVPAVYLHRAIVIARARCVLPTRHEEEVR